MILFRFFPIIPLFHYSILIAQKIATEKYVITTSCRDSETFNYSIFNIH